MTTKISFLKRPLCLALCAALFMCALSGCRDDGGADPAPSESVSSQTAAPVSSENEAPSLSVAISADADLNPYTSQNRLSLYIAPLVYEGLFKLSPDFTAENLLCESFSTADNQTFVFKIKEDVTFHSGAAMGASDAEYSIKLAMSGARSPYRKRLSCISRVRATGANELTITLSSKNCDFPALLDVPIVRRGDGESAVPDGTGPFSPKIDDDGKVSSLVLFPLWHKHADMPVDEVSLFRVSKTDELVFAIEDGDVDLVQTDKLAAAPINYRGDVETRSYPTNIMHFIGMNHKNRILSDPDMRKAIFACIDRLSIINDMYSGFGDEAFCPISSASAQFSELSGDKKAAPDAKTVLQSAGIADSNGDGAVEYAGADVSLSLIVNNDNPAKTAAAYAIADALTYAGIGTTVTEMWFDDFSAAVKSGAFDLYYGETAVTPDFDISEMISKSGKLNYGGFSSAELLSRYDAYRASNPSERAAARNGYIAQFLEDVPFAPILFERAAVLTRSGKVSDLVSSPGDIFYGFPSCGVK